MPKKKTSSKESAPCTAIGAISPTELFDLLEQRFDDRGTSPYRRVYLESRRALLAAEGQTAVNFATLLENVDEAAGVELATRGAGFVLGFATCRRLLLGELDLAQLKGGAQ